MGSQIKSVMSLLNTESPDVRYIGIHGMGGIGKTTLAKVIFEELSASFDCSCFLEDIRESSSRCNGLQDLRKQLQEVLDPEFARGCNSFRVIEERFQRKKVLIVLDNVNKSEQIKKLAGQLNWFGSGSRIIVTTRDVDVLSEFGNLDQNEVQFFEISNLEHDQSLELFKWYAFRKEKPPAILETISGEIVSTTGGLPLALKVIGSRLYNNKDEALWRDVLKRIKSIPFREVKETLKISYDALEHEQKQIFIDIACFPAMAEKPKAIHLWAASKFFPHLSLAVLSSMSLVKIVDGKTIWMHDVLKDLGKDIVREESTKEPGKRSRVWENQEALDVLISKEGKEKVEALCVDKPLEMSLTSEHFASFQELRFLKLVSTDIEGDFKNLLPKLAWFSWHLCPPVLTAINLCLRNLVILDLSFSFIDETWGGWSLIQILNNLKVLDLSNCHKLTKTPNFFENNRLERLVLRCCSELRQIHGSIGKLQGLKYLNLTNCSSFEVLPNEIGYLVNLEELRVSRSWGYRGIHKLPESVGNLKSLSVLELEYLEIVDIPDTIRGLTKLKHLSLNECLKMKALPESLGDLKSLIELTLSKTGISKLPDSLGGLIKLESLLLTECSSLEVLPDSLGDLQELKVLKVLHCKIRKLPVSMRMMKKLEEIELFSTLGMPEELPQEIGNFSSLRVLSLIGSSISSLPSSITQLPLLEKLSLVLNNQLRELPSLPLSLKELHISSLSLKKIPDLSSLANLKDLMLVTNEDCKFEGMEKLTKLRRLVLGLTNATALQIILDSLTQLESFGLDFLPRSTCSAIFQSISPDVYTSPVNLRMKLPDLSNLKNLSDVEFGNCLIKDGLGIQLPEKVIRVEISNCVAEVIELCLTKNLRYLTIYNCKSVLRLPNLSQLKKLNGLHITCCENLVEIPGLGKLELLNKLTIHQCDSLEGLENLSELKKLSEITLSNCPKLRTIEGTDSLFFSSLMIYNCRSIQNTDELQKRSKAGRIENLRFENFVGS